MRKTSSTNYNNEQDLTMNCPITSTFLVVGGRWKLTILWVLKDGPMRYKAIHRVMPLISEKMLTQQLGSLVEDGWVVKKDYGEIPPRTEYSLTELAQSFLPILYQIYDWGIEKKIIDQARAKCAHP